MLFRRFISAGLLVVMLGMVGAPSVASAQALTVAELQSFYVQIMELVKIIEQLKAALAAKQTAVATPVLDIVPDNLADVRKTVSTSVQESKIEDYDSISELRAVIGHAPLGNFLKEYADLGGTPRALGLEFATVNDFITFFEGTRISDFTEFLSVLDRMGARASAMHVEYGGFRTFLTTIKTDFPGSKLSQLNRTLAAINNLGGTWSEVVTNGGFANAKDLFTTLRNERKLGEVGSVFEKAKNFGGSYRSMFGQGGSQNSLKSIMALLNRFGLGQLGGSGTNNLGYLGGIFDQFGRMGGNMSSLTGPFGGSSGGFGSFLNTAGRNNVGNMFSNLGGMASRGNTFSQFQGLGGCSGGTCSAPQMTAALQETAKAPTAFLNDNPTIATELPPLDDMAVGSFTEGQQFRSSASGYHPYSVGSSNQEMEGGELDCRSNKIFTLQQYLRGQALYVSTAMDKIFPYNTKLRIPEYEQKYNSGKYIDFRMVDTGGAFYGAGTSKIDIAVDTEADAREIGSGNGVPNVTVIVEKQDGSGKFCGEK